MHQAFILRPYVESDMHRIVEIVNAQSEAQTTVEEGLRIERQRSPEDKVLRLMATTADGAIAGTGLGYSGIGTKPDEFGIKIRVDQPYQQQGAGRALYQAIEAWAIAQGATRLAAGVREVHEDALAWARRRGYEVEHHIFRSRLPLADWNAAAFAPYVEQTKAAGIRFSSFAAEITGEASYERCYDFIGRLMDDIPGALGRNRAPYERWRNNFRTRPEMDPAGWIMAIDGNRWVGLSSVVRRPDEGYFTGFTGIEREYRGRGIALALKVVSLEYARSIGAREIFTSNHSVNAPMLAINRKLGYLPEPGSFNLAKLVQAS
ncbi:MAG TPA: GNAT family N-acetyltransferase [Symbiobacteriaceae bacterium]|nr:GNAT family N-acetyltransferase [Symbiobacteriaceae bacterium]